VTLISLVAGSVASYAATPVKYADAFQDTMTNGKPLVVLVGAEWCPACQSMKTSIMPAVAAKGDLDKVAFTLVNTDKDRELSSKLLEGNMIPQLVKYEKIGDNWKITRLVGAQSIEAVESFVTPTAQPVAAQKAATPNQLVTAPNRGSSTSSKN
jgi:thiol-disulfide isomerase/thioredoxin